MTARDIPASLASRFVDPENLPWEKTRYPGIEHITICEIEPVIPPTSTRFFGKQNYEVYRNPKTRVVFDDARHYLLTTTNKYDIIASDPLDIFAKGTAAMKLTK